MEHLVDKILAERAARDDRTGRRRGLTIALFLHLGLVAAVLLGPRLFAEPREPIEYVEVTIIPAQILGTTKPQPRPTPPRPEPEPEPEVEIPEPEPDPVEPEVEVPERKPDPDPIPPPEPDPKPVETAEPAQPEPAESDPPQPPQVGPTEREGSPTGSPVGTSEFGAAISLLDNPNFTYGYYIDQMLGSIKRHWRRPQADRIETLIGFRILKNGEVIDLSIKESSGNRAFDLAALRAVQNASPLPALPRSYREDSLGVELVVR